jgi:hypothetical protein
MKVPVAKECERLLGDGKDKLISPGATGRKAVLLRP